MNARIKDKISEIRRYSRELRGILPSNFEEYDASLEKKAACERYLEKIVEATVDLAFIFIKKEGLKVPEDYSQAFDILEMEGVISAELTQNLKHAKGMRNVVAHQYGGVNDKLVFHALKTRLVADAEKFTKECEKHAS